MLVKSRKPEMSPVLSLVEPKESVSKVINHILSPEQQKIGILFITTFPPRECGIATYTQDLILTLNKSFGESFNIKICALASESENHTYPQKVTHILHTDQKTSYQKLADDINNNPLINVVVLQHEFGLYGQHGQELINMLHQIQKPVVIVFHTVLPYPNLLHIKMVRALSVSADRLIVMTKNSLEILSRDYEISKSKIEVIPHGTHLVVHEDKDTLKAKYGLTGKKVLSTFGFLGSGKNIETTLAALPEIISFEPDTVFLIIGKTHRSTILREGESYRDMLKERITTLGLQDHVRFVNAFLPLSELLECLQLTDIYLFTSKDPNQAVSGTFVYAISCGCPIISTPIPHATEVLGKDAGVIIDFCAPDQLAASAILLLENENFRNTLSMNGLHQIASTAWENSAISHAVLFGNLLHDRFPLHYNLPEINLSHIKKMTTDIGIIQFSKINIPDLETGYTLDDNARALIAICQHYKMTLDPDDLRYIKTYFYFIKRCFQKEGDFLNYVDKNLVFTTQNGETNLEDCNGRSIWSLGYLLSIGDLLPKSLLTDVHDLFDASIKRATKIHSTRSMAFIIKGLYFANTFLPDETYKLLIFVLAKRLVNMFLHESNPSWLWYESYLTYGNSTIPEAMLCAYLSTGEEIYKETAEITFDFLLSKTFYGHQMKVISNQTWMYKDKKMSDYTPGGEQPIDVAYTVLALKRFAEVFKNKGYQEKMKQSFQWFLGKNHLHQIMYNPRTGGCYDGLEEHNVNLNQGAESTVSYLMARLAIVGLY